MRPRLTSVLDPAGATALTDVPHAEIAIAVMVEPITTFAENIRREGRGSSPAVTAFAALSGPLPKAGVVVVALMVAVMLLGRGDRVRAAAMLGALVLAPALLLADIWHSPQLGLVHRHPLVAAAGALVAAALVAGVAALITRRPALLGALAVVALPFRIPIQAAGITSNLLVPLYLVVAAGSLAFIVPALRDRQDQSARAGSNGTVDSGLQAGWIERLLALYVVLYAVQSIYSTDFEKALQQIVFFYVPFALMFCLLRRLPWTARLVRRSLELIAVLAVLFAAIGFVEYATKTIILNPKLVIANGQLGVLRPGHLRPVPRPGDDPARRGPAA
jgi:putative inorganic carbon (hco3(-)) transporter